MSASKPFCPICSLFRETPLHFYELAIYCELLNNEKAVYKLVNRMVKEGGVAKTTSIAKWLRLASQLYASLEPHLPFKFGLNYTYLINNMR